MRVPVLAQVRGVWDLTTQPLVLGPLLTFAAELLVLRQISDALKVRVAALAGDQVLTMPILLRMLGQIEGLECERQVWPGQRSLPLMASTGAVAWWPSAGVIGHDTTLFLQSWFKKHGTRPRITWTKRVTEKAKRTISHYAGGKKALIVHLRNKPGALMGNANLDAWHKYFLTMEQEHVHFFLIGNENLGSGIERLPQITITEKIGLSLPEELALISQGSAFMGMSSGPGNAAIFGKKPYVIFKHPRYHAEVMKRELGNKDHFNFAEKGQYFERRIDTVPALMEAWKRIKPFI